jgi:hypothetical protein
MAYAVKYKKVGKIKLTPEEEKGKRLDKTIKFLKEEK